jgi:hypothetical protein
MLRNPEDLSIVLSYQLLECRDVPTPRTLNQRHVGVYLFRYWGLDGGHKERFRENMRYFRATASIRCQHRRFLASVPAQAPANQFGRRAASPTTGSPPLRTLNHACKARPDSAPYLGRFTAAFHFRVIAPAV